MTGFVFSKRSEEHFAALTDMVQKRLDEYGKALLDSADRQKEAAEAMVYSLSAGGKRIRPLLLLEFCGICGGDTENALSAACAIEMVHTFSLIHDDLPCMDNDDMRRGKPSCHIAFGEANALLAGDALLNMAFEVICGEKNLAPDTKIALISELSRAVGVSGMIGGQVIDTTYKGEITKEVLTEMYLMKTGALLRAACKMGCIAAGADTEKCKAAELYAEKLGLAFQIIDDILDVEGNEAVLGKPVGSDSENGKITYVTLNGIEQSRQTAEKLTNEAVEALGAFDDTDNIKELTLFLLKRDR